MKRIGKLHRKSFTRLEIIDALESMGQIELLDNLLATPAFKRRWDNATVIDLDNPLTAAAIEQAGIDAQAVIIEIARQK